GCPRYFIVVPFVCVYRTRRLTTRVQHLVATLATRYLRFIPYIFFVHRNFLVGMAIANSKCRAYSMVALQLLIASGVPTLATPWRPYATRTSRACHGPCSFRRLRLPSPSQHGPRQSLALLCSATGRHGVARVGTPLAIRNCHTNQKITMDKKYIRYKT